MRSAAEHWSMLLIDQRFEVLGGAVRATELAQQLIASFDPDKDSGVIPELEARKKELRGIHDTRASEVADVIWRTITTLKERVQTAMQSSAAVFAQGHAPSPAFIVGPGPTGQVSPNGWSSKND